MKFKQFLWGGLFIFAVCTEGRYLKTKKYLRDLWKSWTRKPSAPWILILVLNKALRWCRLEKGTFNNEEVTLSAHCLHKLNKCHLGLNSRSSAMLQSYWKSQFWAGNNQLCLTLGSRWLQLISSVNSCFQ